MVDSMLNEVKMILLKIYDVYAKKCANLSPSKKTSWNVTTITKIKKKER